jgi:recombination protein RecT
MSTPTPSPTQPPNNNAARAVAAGVPAPSRLNPIAVFKNELADRVDRLTTYLPDGVTLKRFTDTAIAAVATNPSLLNCDRTSLHVAVLKAAKSGLMPDGRESCIVPRKGKAEWQPMVYGLRKRFMELGGIIVDAAVVHANDSFHHELGDEPLIHHAPLDPRKRGEDGKFLSRGEMVAAYAIFRKDGKIIHRETMYAADIERVKSMVQAKDSLMWSKFPSEGWRKSVIHRGAKSLPLVPELAEIFARENEDIDWAAEEAAATPPAPAANPFIDPPLDEIPLTDDDVTFVHEGPQETNNKETDHAA